MKTLFFIVAVWVAVCCIASAERIEIHQGDLVYLNETVDISLAVSWPDYQLAWCDNENYECSPPDQIIEVTGNMHKYFINPTVFRYGTYYRWDGQWNRGENAVAFTIVNGTRHDKITHSNSDIDVTAMIPAREGPFSYLIARGDWPMVSTRLNRTDTCYLWAFTNTVDVLGKFMIPVREESGFSSYTYTFSESETMNMTVDSYPAYIVCNGANHIPDIYMDGPLMRSPYKSVEDITIDSWNPYNIKTKYDTMAASEPNGLYDDVVYPVELMVSEPYIAITNIERNEDDTKLFISGETSWENQTVLTFKLDPDNYKLAQDIRLHTWTTTASGSLDAPRKFATALSLEKRELSVGMHEIVATVEKNTDVGYSAYSFRVSDISVMPTPTPEIKRVLQMEDRTEMTVRTPVTPSVTPEITKAYTNVTGNVTAMPVVTVETTVVPTETPVPTKTTPVVVPVPITVIIAGLIIALMVRK